MKSYREELTFETKTRRAYLNITPQVEAALKNSGVKEGLCLVNPMHSSASGYINDDEAGLLQDHDDFLGLVRQIMGREVVVAITNGKLDFGPWEQIFYGEFDGRRKKRALIKIIGE